MSPLFTVGPVAQSNITNWKWQRIVCVIMLMYSISASYHFFPKMTCLFLTHIYLYKLFNCLLTVKLYVVKRNIPHLGCVAVFVRASDSRTYIQKQYKVVSLAGLRTSWHFSWFQDKLSVWLVSGQVVSLAGFRASCHFGWSLGNLSFWLVSG